MADVKNRPSYYAVIPANVRYDDRLSASEKILYGEITALASSSGECWASNNYFAKLYNAGASSVSRWVKHLRECGYINVTLIVNTETHEVVKRVITIVEDEKGVFQKWKGVFQKEQGVLQKCSNGYSKNEKENITRSNIKASALFLEERDANERLLHIADGLDFFEEVEGFTP